MGKFCGKCGSMLDPDTGRCPICDIVPEAEPMQQVSKQRGRPKPEKILKAVIAVLILVVVVFSVFLILIGIGIHRDKVQLKENLTITLEAIQRGSIDSDAMFLLGDPVRLRGTTSVGEKIVQGVEFQIRQVTVRGDEGQVNLYVKAPDAVNILSQVAESMDEFQEISYLNRVEEALEGSYPTAEFEIIVYLDRVNNNWYLIPSGEFLNAISGGLVAERSRLEREFLEELIGEKLK